MITTPGVSSGRRPFSLPVSSNAVGLAVAGILLLSAPAGAQITDCAGLCPNSGSYCPVEHPVDVEPGSFLDCSGKDIFIRDPSGNIFVTGGSFALRANTLSLLPGHRIVADESTAVPTGVEIDVDWYVALGGTITARNGGKGSHVYLRSATTIDLYGTSPVIDVSGGASSCDGGLLMLDAMGDISIGSRLDANGKEGGTDENVNSGGYVQITSGGIVRVYEEIRAFGRFYDGGIVDILALDLIDLLSQPNTARKGQINVEGRNIDGYGGLVSLLSDGAVTLSGPIFAGGGMNVDGGEAMGGEVEVFAGCGGVSMTDEIDLRGGSEGGGYLKVDSLGPITLSGEILAQSRKNGGDGGQVELASGGLVKLELASVINADGHDTTANGIDGEGGVVVLQGCQVNVVDDASTGATVTALGARGGAILVEGAKTTLSTTGYSVTVGDKSTLNATGTSLDGSVEMSAAERRFGRCSNNVEATCQTSSECVFGCNSGTCTNPVANPDTQLVLSQFQPAPTIRQRTGLLPCESSCN